jgi:hypothetical protein
LSRRGAESHVHAPGSSVRRFAGRLLASNIFLRKMDKNEVFVLKWRASLHFPAPRRLPQQVLGHQVGQHASRRVSLCAAASSPIRARKSGGRVRYGGSTEPKHETTRATSKSYAFSKNRKRLRPRVGASLQKYFCSSTKWENEKNKFFLREARREAGNIVFPIIAARKKPRYVQTHFRVCVAPRKKPCSLLSPFMDT